MRKIALLVFSESTSREDAYLSRCEFMQQEVSYLRQRLSDDFYLYIPSVFPIRSKADLKLAVSEVSAQSDICACLLYTGTFVNASDVAMAVRILNIPCALLGNHHPKTMSEIGFLAAAGAIEQAGLEYKRFDGDIHSESELNKLCSYFKAAATKKKLVGETFGMIGGRSLGISTGTADTAQWLNKFGIDITHIDQLEIVRRAQAVSTERVKHYAAWITENYGKLCYKEDRFDSEKLDRMIRTYLGLKDIIAAENLDFLGIKCQTDLSNGYVLPCLAIQLLTDPYDADGPKEPIACSCEADADGALTMEILKFMSNGSPVALQDIFSITDEEMVLANCGAGASYFSNYRCNDAQSNLRNVYLQPHGFGEAGGASTQFVFAPGVYTYARLTRSNMNYRMLITRGSVMKKNREDLNDYSWYRPTAVVKMEADKSFFHSKISSNHLHCVQGDYTAELVEFCKLMDIPYDLLITENRAN